MRILIIDDERVFDDTINDYTIYARNLNDAKYYFFCNDWDRVYLDHDLGNGEEVKALTAEIEEDAYHGIIYKVGKFIIHSANPVGRMEMYNALSPFYNVEFAQVEDLLNGTLS